MNYDDSNHYMCSGVCGSVSGDELGCLSPDNVCTGSPSLCPVSPDFSSCIRSPGRGRDCGGDPSRYHSPNSSACDM